jgi:hypothetical protein
MGALRANLVFLSLATAVTLGLSHADASPTSKIDLRVVYVGMPGPGRADDFVPFLGKHFAEVGHGDLAEFRESDADGYDVVILDYDGDGFKAPRPSLSRTYARPTVLVGVMGALLSGNLGLKTGYI